MRKLFFMSVLAALVAWGCSSDAPVETVDETQPVPLSTSGIDPGPDGCGTTFCSYILIRYNPAMVRASEVPFIRQQILDETFCWYMSTIQPNDPFVDRLYYGGCTPGGPTVGGSPDDDDEGRYTTDSTDADPSSGG